LVAVSHQACIAPTPRAVRLQVSETAPAKIVKSFGVLPFAH
jgi:hypothetical protein